MLGYKLVKKEKSKRHIQNGHIYELAFEIEGEKFYRFIELDNLVTYARYEYVQKYLELFYLRLTPESLKNLFTAIANAADKGKIGLCGSLALEGLERSAHLSNSGAAYYVAAQVFFKKDDDLRAGIEGEELTRRINLFKKKELSEVLFIEPLASLCNFQSLLDQYSKTYLTAHLKRLSAIQNGRETRWARIAGEHTTQ